MRDCSTDMWLFALLMGVEAMWIRHSILSVAKCNHIHWLYVFSVALYNGTFFMLAADIYVISNNLAYFNKHSHLNRIIRNSAVRCAQIVIIMEWYE